jgi:hypothetical protein
LREFCEKSAKIFVNFGEALKNSDLNEPRELKADLKTAKKCKNKQR